MPTEPSAYDQGHVAGEIAARLAAHDQHFAQINGSMGRLADEMHALVLGVQRLGDAADADRATVVTTASALEKAEQARRDKTETRWSPMARLITVVVAVAVVAGVLVAYANLHHHP